MVKNPPASAGDMGLKIPKGDVSWEDPLEKEMATYSSILTWEIPWTEGPWQATVHGVTGFAKIRTQLSDQTTTTEFRLLQKNTEAGSRSSEFRITCLENRQAPPAYIQGPAFFFRDWRRLRGQDI